MSSKTLARGQERLFNTTVVLISLRLHQQLKHVIADVSSVSVQGEERRQYEYEHYYVFHLVHGHLHLQASLRVPHHPDDASLIFQRLNFARNL